MRSTLRVQSVAVLLLVLILFSQFSCPVQCGSESPAAGISTACAQFHADGDDAVPHSDNNFDPDTHDHACIGCPCHAPLVSALHLPAYAPSVAAIAGHDLPFHLPEVYLPRFVPPQLAV